MEVMNETVDDLLGFQKLGGGGEGKRRGSEKQVITRSGAYVECGLILFD